MQWKIVSSIMILIMASAPVLVCGQVVPSYPVEIDLSPCGFGNQVPGNKIYKVSSFSSLKIVLYKDLVKNLSWFANSVNFEGTADFYHDITKARAFNPIYTNLVSRSFFFVDDIFTLGVELIGNIVTQTGIDKMGDIFNNINYRGRVKPFHYLALTPDLLFQEGISLGTSVYSDSSSFQTTSGTADLTKDFYIYKYETSFIYFTPFKTRIFLSPYLFYDRYKELAASSADGAYNSLNPKLREEGIGLTIGAQYSTIKRGLTEGTFEIERNTDIIFGANTYTKLRAYLKSENKSINSITKRIGYSGMVMWTKHLMKNLSTGAKEENAKTGLASMEEVMVDAILIYNFNNYLSFRPEYEFIHQWLPLRRSFERSQTRLQFHVIF